MKSRGLLIATVLLVALAGAVYWAQKHPESAEKAKTDADTPPKILTLAEDQFKEIKLAKASLPEVVVSRLPSGDWQVTQPVPLRADQESVHSLVTTLAALTGDRVIDEKPSSLGAYGLDAPVEKITVAMKDGKTHTLLLGADTPSQGGVYAKLGGAAKVYTIPSYVKSNLDKTANDLRDRRLLTFTSEKVSRIEVTAKGATTEFGKNGANEWQIVKPKPMRADNSQVDEVLRKLHDAKMEASVSDDDAKKATAAFATGEKVATAAVTDAGGTQSIEIRKSKDNVYYAKSTAVEGIFKAANDLGEGLAKKPDDFRNKKLFDFGFAETNTLTIRPGTSAPVTYTKIAGNWSNGSVKLDASGMEAVMDKLRDLMATGFPEKASGDPVFEITVVSDSNKRTEKVIIRQLAEKYTGQRDGEAGYYELDAKSVTDLQKTIAGIKPQPAAAAKK